MLDNGDRWYSSVGFSKRWKYRNHMRLNATLSRNTVLWWDFSYSRVTHMSLSPSKDFHMKIAPFFCDIETWTSKEKRIHPTGPKMRLSFFILKHRKVKCYHGNPLAEEKWKNWNWWIFIRLSICRGRKFRHVVSFIRELDDICNITFALWRKFLFVGVALRLYADSDVIG